MMWRAIRVIEPVLLKVYQRLSSPPVPNLHGDRDIEYSWIAANMPSGSGKALDFGCGVSWMGVLAARKGYDVTAIDLRPISWPYDFKGLSFVQGDIRSMKFPPVSLNLIINCSSIEHVGLLGRYGTEAHGSTGDVEAMSILRHSLAPDGVMLLTIPIGQDGEFAPHHRVYGQERLPKLLDGFEVCRQEYWGKDASNRWIRISEREALHCKASETYYCLGLFVLKREPPVGEKVET